MADIMPGADENAVQDVQPVLMNLRKVAEETGAAIELIHHSNKSGHYRGSSAISGAVDLLLKVESFPGTHRIDLQSVKARDVEFFRMAAHIRFEEDPFKVFISRADLAQASKFSAGESYVLRYLKKHGPSTVKAIQDHADSCSPVTARKAVYSLALGNFVERIDEGGTGAEATYQITQTCT